MSATEVSAYLNFQGECEAAFKFYEQVLGARVGQIFRYAGTPLEATVPADWSDKVMHGSVTIGQQLLMGADVGPDRYEAPKGFSLSLSVESAADADRVFEELGKGGRVLLPLEKTFWAERFGMVVDRFAIPWMVSCESAEQA
jgi:PhnB protein